MSDTGAALGDGYFASATLLSELNRYCEFLTEGETPPCPYCDMPLPTEAIICGTCNRAVRIGSWPTIRAVLLKDPAMTRSDSQTAEELARRVRTVDLENPLVGQYSPQFQARVRAATGPTATGFELENWFNSGRVCQEAGDAEGARMWFSHGARNGDARAALNLGVMCDEAGDPSAEQWYLTAWELGLPQGATGLGCVYLDRDDRISAKKWFSLASQGGDPQATYNLACVAEAEFSIDEAQELHKAAARAGHIGAAVWLGRRFCRLQMWQEAAQWLEPAALAGSGEAHYYLAVVAQANGEAAAVLHHLQQAADGGIAEAAALLASMDADKNSP